MFSYDPLTNTIQRRNPTQNKIHMPHLLNLAPQDLNYAMRTTSFLHQNKPMNLVDMPKSKPSQPIPEERFEQKKPSFTHMANLQEENSNTVLNDIKYIDIPPQGFHSVEDINRTENDVYDLPRPPKDFRKTQNFVKSSVIESQVESKEASPKYKIKTPAPLAESVTLASERQTDTFRLLSPENPILNYKPENYTLNEKILNARFVKEEQEKTKKIVMDRIGQNIELMEKKTKSLEEEFAEYAEATKDIDIRTKQLYEEVDKKRFQIQADGIIRNLDFAEKYEANDVDLKVENFFKENQAIYDEIERLMNAEITRADRLVTTNSIVSGTQEFGTSKISRSVLATEAAETKKNFRRTSHQTKKSSQPKKSLVAVVSAEKTKGAVGAKWGPKKASPQKKNEVGIVKHPDRFEKLLQNTKKFASEY